MAGMKINIGDTWRTVSATQINIGDSWKAAYIGPFNGHATLVNGLLEFWGFTTNADGDSGVYDCTVEGATHNASGGKPGGYYDFDGTNDYMDTNAYILDEETACTVSTWIKTTDKNRSQYIIGSKDATKKHWFTLFIRDDGYIDGGIGDGTNTVAFSQDGSADADDGSWHMVSVTWDGTNVRRYIDGGATGTVDNSGSVSKINLIGNLYIGNVERAGSPLANLFVNGDIDSVGIWDRALTVGELGDLYNGGDGLTY